ncbi:HEAT repeat domain-containing protein [Desulfobulbus elongatus]|uniref:HEAT repeat domain-containing protein n=1 Tax=Desulfobulbus elongatus TaxID=53332 RepID=UPI0006862AA7|nr:HEAT repeat domain-containing protein [Desulfobulbus elongatus]
MADQSPTTSQSSEISDDVVRQVIADFLALGHVDNIVAMVRQEPRYLAWTGQLLEDERYAVRLGVAVLFEHLTAICPEHLFLAVPGLTVQLCHPLARVRGEAASVLGTIATDEALAVLPPLLHDPSPQVVEVVRDILDSTGHG